jgi:cell division protein FtsA
VDTIQKVPKQVLTSIIRPRLEETFALLGQQLEDEGRFANMATRVVLTGGASQLQGVADLAAQMLGRTVRLGAPTALAAMPDVGKGPGFSVAAGLLACAAEPDRTYAMPQQAREAIDRSQLSYAQRVGRWLVESL